MWCLLLLSFQGAVSAGGDVLVHGSAAGPSWSVEPAGTQPVRSGHHGRGVGKGHLCIFCTVEQQVLLVCFENLRRKKVLRKVY